MKTNKTIIVLLSTILVSGCAKTVWTNPNVSDRQEQKDLTECQRNAERKNEPMQSCMTSKGYHLLKSAQQ